MSDPNKADTRRGWGVGTGFAPNLSVSSPDTNLVSKHTAIMSPRKQWCNSHRVNKWSCMESHRSFWCNSLSARGESCLGCFRQGGFLCLGRLGVFHLCPTLFLGWKCAEKIFQRGLLNLSLCSQSGQIFLWYWQETLRIYSLSVQEITSNVGNGRSRVTSKLCTLTTRLKSSVWYNNCVSLKSLAVASWVLKPIN